MSGDDIAKRLAEIERKIGRVLESEHEAYYGCPVGDGCGLCDVWHMTRELLTALREAQEESHRRGLRLQETTAYASSLLSERDALQRRVEALEAADRERA